MHAAGTAKTGTTAVFRAAELQAIAQNPEQRCVRGDIYILFVAIDSKSEGSHKEQNILEPNYNCGKQASRCKEPSIVVIVSAVLFVRLTLMLLWRHAICILPKLLHAGGQLVQA